ncbi:MAG: hypothetical protein ACREIT_08010, partial [Tepidisphaeraceae bacterium]
MKTRIWAMVVALALVSGGWMAYTHADDVAKADKPAKAEKKRATRLTKPWSELANLTDEQKTQIADIHA